MDKTLLQLGQKKYSIVCAQCHGVLGDGNSIVAENMGLRLPPSLLELADKPAGHFYTAITEGYGVMPSFSGELNTQERWAVVAYVRALQAARGSAAGGAAAPSSGEPMISVERYTGTPKLMVPAFGLGVLGLVLTAVGAFMGTRAPRAHSYLFAFTYWVGIAVASIIMVAIFHTAKAKWMTVLRRAMETMAVAVPIFAVLFLGLIPVLKHLYPWVPGSELASRHERAWSATWHHKQHGYLNLPRSSSCARSSTSWCGSSSATRLHGWSTQQDETGELELTVKQRFLVARRPALPCAHDHFCFVRLADEPHAALAVHHLSASITSPAASWRPSAC